MFVVAAVSTMTGINIRFNGCRYKWQHGIAAVAIEEFGGEHNQRGQRTSITFRKLVRES